MTKLGKNRMQSKKPLSNILRKIGCISTFNRTRFQGTEEGWENHFPSGDPKTEVVTLLSIYQTVRYCDSISKQDGNFGNTLLAQMELARGKHNVTVAQV
jgi:hypothetical protein